jgi:hypothetical protein
MTRSTGAKPMCLVLAFRIPSSGEQGYSGANILHIALGAAIPSKSMKTVKLVFICCRSDHSIPFARNEHS